MELKINLAVGITFSFIYGIMTFYKYYHYISASELFLLIFLRVLITFIFFFALSYGICFFLKQQVPKLFPKLKPKKPGPTKVDYILPSVSPTTSVEEPAMDKLEKKESLPEEIAKTDAETLAMVIRTMMAETEK